jgi:hypothetical protein
VLRCDDGEAICVTIRHGAAPPFNIVLCHRQQQPRRYAAQLQCPQSQCSHRSDAARTSGGAVATL